jgi:hypothetical protein
MAYCMDKFDAEFFAHARTDVPLLLAEVKRLKDAVVKAAEEWRDDQDDVPEIDATLMRAVDALRAAKEPTNG